MTPLRVSVQGSTENAVLIVGLRAIVESIGPSPQRGIPIRRPTAGAIDVRAFTIDLESEDSSRPWQRQAPPACLSR